MTGVGLRIQGRSVVLPVEVRRARSWAAHYAVPADAAQHLVEPAGLRVATPLPGRTVLTLAFVRYEDGDLDAYDELGVTFLVRPHDARPAGTVRDVVDAVRSRAGVFVHRLPVNRPFTLEAGRAIWGFPKFLADFEMYERGTAGRCVLRADGQHVLTLSVAGGGMPTRLPAPPTYTCLDGTLRVTRWRADAWARARPGGAEIELGTHPIAEELRSLGLPTAAMASTAVPRLRARFGPARIVQV